MDTELNKSSQRKICPFLITHKKRFCRMTVGNGSTYCGEHSYMEKIEGNEKPVSCRMPCPYDNRHSCYTHSLLKHMKKCNARPSDLPRYISKNINKEVSIDLLSPKLADVELSYLNVLLDKVKSVHEGLGDFIEDKHLDHSILNEALSDPSLGFNSRRHLIQNASLLGHVCQFDLSGRLGVIEFGAGKGQLTYWLGKTLPNPDQCQFMVIDKGTLRHKSENKIKEPDLGNVNRYRVDIADLRLSRLPPALLVDKNVAASKHLCGAATDLALRCIINGKEESEELIVSGIVIAVCCHHRCDWSTYTGKEFLLENGFSPPDFGVMCGIAGWATSGGGQKKHFQENLQPCVDINDDISLAERKKKLDLTTEERASYGKMVKNLLDYGRKRFLDRNGYECYLRYYVEPEVSPENVCLWAQLKR